MLLAPWARAETVTKFSGRYPTRKDEKMTYTAASRACLHAAARPTWFAAWALSMCFACVRPHTVFEEGAEAGGGGMKVGEGGAGSGGGPAPSMKPWDQETCVAALSNGKNGDACVAPLKCSAFFDCLQLDAACNEGALLIGMTDGVCSTSCSADSDCKAGQICEAYECQNCPSDVCWLGWSSIVRNACTVCVPPSQCKSDKECGDSSACFAGLSCLPGCKGDPLCCFGNQCALSECGSPPLDDCLKSGCVPGTFCAVTGEAQSCKCDPSAGKWLCSAESVNQCQVR